MEFIVGSWAVYTGFGLGALSILRALIPSALVTVLCWLSVWFTLDALAGVGIGGTLAMFISAAVCGPVWLGALFLTRHPLADELKRFAASRFNKARTA